MKRLTSYLFIGAAFAVLMASCSPRNKQKCDAYSKVELESTPANAQQR
ncbi:MAG: hypothetical protein ACFCUH_04185 [Flavobacteriales bacterium]